MTSELTREECRAVLRLDFGTFLEWGFRRVYPGQSFIRNWHTNLLAAKLEECRRGTCLRLMINMPPKHLKSYIASVAFPAWLLGHDPSAKVLSISYGRPLVDPLARDFLRLVSAPVFKQVFPAFELADRRPAVAHIRTTQNGGRVATTAQGALTGLDADYIVADDLIKAVDCQSAVRRKSVNEELAATLCERLRDKRTGRIILAGQRLHEDDPFGYLLQRPGEIWDVLSLAAIAEEPQTYVWTTPFGTFGHHRAIGDVLHAAREPLAVLQAIRASEGEYHWASRYQQRPAPSAGSLINERCLKYYREEELPETFDFKVQSWDTANSPGASSDYSVGQSWGIKGNSYWLIDQWRARVGFSDLRAAALRLRDEHRPDKILIENRASGIQLIELLREHGIDDIVACRSHDDKINRFAAQTDLIENGFVYLPQGKAFVPEYLHELKTFPKGRYDDQVDATAQALEWLRRNKRLWATCMPAMGYSAPYPDWSSYAFGPGALVRKQPDEVMLRTPVGTTYQDINGHSHQLAAGDTIAVPRDCVASLIGIGWKRV